MSITIERNALFVTRYGANNEIMLKPGTNVLEESEYAVISEDDNFIASVERGDNEVLQSDDEEADEASVAAPKSRKRRSA